MAEREVELKYKNHFKNLTLSLARCEGCKYFKPTEQLKAHGDCQKGLGFVSSNSTCNLFEADDKTDTGLRILYNKYLIVANEYNQMLLPENQIEPFGFEEWKSYRKTRHENKS